jgi:hypothetical protein
MRKAEVKHKSRKSMFREQYLISHVSISVFNNIPKNNMGRDEGSAEFALLYRSALLYFF